MWVSLSSDRRTRCPARLGRALGGHAHLDHLLSGHVALLPVVEHVVPLCAHLGEHLLDPLGDRPELGRVWLLLLLLEVLLLLLHLRIMMLLLVGKLKVELVL